jgi:hypothetical protein
MLLHNASFEAVIKRALHPFAGDLVVCGIAFKLFAPARKAKADHLPDVEKRIVTAAGVGFSRLNKSENVLLRGVFHHAAAGA